MTIHVYDVTTAIGGNIRVVLTDRDFPMKHEVVADPVRTAVAHAAWCKLWENEKDEWGRDTKRQSGTHRMLRKLCDDIGVKTAKDRFTAAIQFKEVTS
jgi:hypothetical protein